MAEPKCPDCPPKGAPAWMATFSDLMSLLMCFFVLLVAFANFNTAGFKSAVGMMQGSMGVLKGDPVMNNPIKMNPPITRGDVISAKNKDKDEAKELDQKEAKKELEKQIQKEGQEENVEVIEGSEGMIVRIKNNILFSTGKADINEDFKALMVRIGAILNRMPNPIEIEGHTDSVPIRNDEFPNNHWLSNSRALTVLDLLADEVGVERQRLSAIGYGEYRPLYDQNGVDAQNNRRVDIKVRYTDPESDQAAPEMVRDMLESEAFEVRETE